MTQKLIVFTRYPEPGQAKTRLIPALGAVGAAAVSRQLTEQTLVQVQTLRQQQPSLMVEIAFAGGTLDRMQAWLGPEWQYTNQGTGDLGQRMARSLQSAFDSGVQQAIIIGTDCPALNGPLLEKAFHALQQSDLVLGPAMDGGYYLIGIRRPLPELFVGIAWSTATVLAQTMQVAAQLGLAIAQLPTLSDIDHPEDLAAWQPFQAQVKGET